MSEPMRFSLKHHGQLSCVEHCPEGEYVLHSDYARLKAEVKRLKEGNEYLGQMHDKEMARSAYLCEQLERLEKGIQPEGSNDAVARAVNVLLEKEKEIARLKSEVEKWEFIHRLDSLAIKKQKEEIERLNEAIVRGAIIPDAKPE